MPVKIIDVKSNPEAKKARQAIVKNVKEQAARLKSKGADSTEGVVFGGKRIVSMDVDS